MSTKKNEDEQPQITHDPCWRSTSHTNGAMSGHIQAYGADTMNTATNGNINNIQINKYANTNYTTTSETSPSCRDDTVALTLL